MCWKFTRVLNYIFSCQTNILHFTTSVLWNEEQWDKKTGITVDPYPRQEKRYTRTRPFHLLYHYIAHRASLDMWTQDHNQRPNLMLFPPARHFFQHIVDTASCTGGIKSAPWFLTHFLYTRNYISHPTPASDNVVFPHGCCVLKMQQRWGY